ncbi:MAG: hypothetical protein V3U87_04880 [Methylococcaceae bacterium]
MERRILSASDSNNFSFFTKKLQFFLITFICLIPNHTIASVYSPKDNGQIKTRDSTSLKNIIGLKRLDFSYFQVEKQQTMTIDSILKTFSLDKEQNPMPLQNQIGRSLGIESFNFSTNIDLIPHSYTLSASDLVDTSNSNVYKGNKASWSFTTISVIIFISIWFMVSVALLIFGSRKKGF